MFSSKLALLLALAVLSCTLIGASMWKHMREWARAWELAHLEAKAAEALAGAKRHTGDTAGVVPLKKRKGKK